MAPKRLSTTDATIAVANLDGEIVRLVATLASPQGLSAARRAELGDRLTMRGQFLGRIVDYEKALQLAEEGVRLEPRNAISWVARAKARATFHEFKAALGDIEHAAAMGASSEIDSVRAAVAQATGRYEEALRLRRLVADTYPTIGSVGAVASILAERGDISEAEAEFTRALALYRDVSPFPVAWLLHQQGQMWMRAGDYPRARALLDRALEVLPPYAQASNHLAWIEAALGEAEKARARLDAVAGTADDPEAKGLLASVLQLSGQTVAAKTWHDLAASQYEDLISRHPRAFLDHAAAFWLGPTGNSQRALELARRNVSLRKTPQSWTLLMRAAQAAGERTTACAAAREGLAWGHQTEPSQALAERASLERMARVCAAPV